MRLTRAVRPDGQRGHAVADADDARRDLSGVAAEVLVRPEHDLHREAERQRRQVAMHLHRLEKLEQRRPVEPRRRGRCG